ncbi:hypothetical protein BU16DRAFT_460873 [Lophium mytilinum]|uniref:Uncharacterized protein n=1 Tax=Lophium mytilinum TaxID=390894 RepID=A0A6A6QX58_9PEZI|nr:hypothetical protein BU16DRAFT_460873 [Lophium mytilinum]
MDPFRYRTAYEALSFHNRQAYGSDSDADGEPSGLGPAQGAPENPLSPEDDSDGMEWAPTEPVQSVRCDPPLAGLGARSELLPRPGHISSPTESTDPSVAPSQTQDGALMDENVRRLVQQFPSVMSHDGSGSFTPSTLEVPRDFGMQMSITINHHLSLVEDRKIMEKYRRLLGHRKDPSKRKNMRLGFDPSELIRKQAVVLPEDAPTQVSTLTNDIHPIFKPENFHGCPDAIYEILKPALRLSTQFLLSRGTSSFWHTLLFGEREVCQQTSQEYGQECIRIRKDVPWSETNATRFEQILLNQADAIHFFFHKNPLPPNPVYASMGLIADYKNGVVRRMNEKCHKSKICLHTDFYTTAKRLSLLQYPDPAMVLRFNLFLAVCVTHEMSHFLEVAGPHQQQLLGRPEVFFYDNMWTESGVAFELKMFGGRVHPVSLRVDCSLGLAVLNYPLKLFYEKEDNVLYTIPMDYVAMLQRQETWEQDFSIVDATFFHIPRSGTKSTELNGTNLMIWEDEQDADISDHIDGKDTTFHRMDNGQIVKNKATTVRRLTKKRWTPYDRPKDQTLATGDCVSKELPEDAAVLGSDLAKEPAETVEMVDDDVMSA